MYGWRVVSGRVYGERRGVSLSSFFGIVRFRFFGLGDSLGEEEFFSRRFKDI